MPAAVVAECISRTVDPARSAHVCAYCSSRSRPRLGIHLNQASVPIPFHPHSIPIPADIYHIPIPVPVLTFCFSCSVFRLPSSFSVSRPRSTSPGYSPPRELAAYHYWPQNRSCLASYTYYNMCLCMPVTLDSELGPAPPYTHLTFTFVPRRRVTGTTPGTGVLA